MISAMSLRLGWLVLAVSLPACGGTQSDAKEPKTAKDKQIADMKASGELHDDSSSTWAGWRYSGDRKDCRYVLGRKCFKTEKAACSAAACRATKCDVVGGGPATVSCHRDEKADREPKKSKAAKER
jgi:hypothetical protein